MNVISINEPISETPQKLKNGTKYRRLDTHFVVDLIFGENKLKSDFSKNLNARGIKAEFKSHTESLTDKQREKAAEKRRFNRELADTYRVIDYGKARYQNNPDKPESFYLNMVSLKGVEKTGWSKGLQ